jgi:hypothetical protein
MINLLVQVSGGVPPFPIRVLIDDLDPQNYFHTTFQRNESLNETIDLPPGKYGLIINGSNPPNGSTEIKLSGSFSTGPNPQSSYNKKTALYTAIFTFTIL